MSVSIPTPGPLWRIDAYKFDVQIWPDGRADLLDADEFDAHKVEFGYPAAVQRAAQEAVEDVLALWRAGAEPFAWYNTRP